MPILLSPDLERLVNDKGANGGYSSAQEVLVEAFRLLRERDLARQRRLEELRGDTAVGLAQAERGELAPLDLEAIVAEGHRRLTDSSA